MSDRISKQFAENLAMTVENFRLIPEAPCYCPATQDQWVANQWVAKEELSRLLPTGIEIGISVYDTAQSIDQCFLKQKIN